MEYLLGGASLLALGALLQWRFGGQGAGNTFGTTRWAKPFELYHAKAFEKGGVRVGDIAGRKSVFYKGPHMVTIGGSGSGKGATAILPSALERKFIFLIDPGGENTAVAAKRWREAGYAFGCINPFGEFSDDPWALPSHGFNPFDLLDPSSDEFVADVTMIAEMLTPRHSHESASADHFRVTAQNVIKGMIIHILTTEPKARRHPGTLYEYMKLPDDKWGALLHAMKKNTACGGIAADAANMLLRGVSMASEETHAVISTIDRNLAFLDDPRMRAFLSRSEVDFSTLKGLGDGKRGAVISVILPLKYLTSHMVIQRLAVACAIKTLQAKPVAKSNVLMVLDEAASLGRIEDFPVWLATLRKYNVSIWSVWQGLGQIKEHYGRSWEVVLSNCGLKQFLGFSDLETAKYAEELLGRATVESVSRSAEGKRSFGQTGRSLKFAEELLRLPQGVQIAVMENHQPLRLKKTPYWSRPEFAGRYYDNPFRKQASAQPSALDALMALWGDVYGALVWWLAPSKTAAVIYGALILAGLITLSHAVV
jgi:type IV secretion system protein VirD4